MRFYGVMTGAFLALQIAAVAQTDFAGGNQNPPRRGGSTGQGGSVNFGGAQPRSPFFNNDINPLQNHTMELLQRPEVQRHIALTLKQRNLLDEAMGESQKEMQDKLRQNNQNSNLRNFRNLPPEQQQQAALELRQANAALMAQFQQWQGEIDEK